MKKTVILFFLISLSFISCNKQDQPVSPDINTTISGRVTLNGTALSGSSIRLDNSWSLSTQTDQFGKFVFYGIPKGDHSLKIDYSFGNGSTISQSTNLQVQYQNIDLGEIRFPKPPVIMAIDSTTNLSKPSIFWNKVDDADFNEYTVYKKSTPDIDESTGELIGTFSNKADTVFSDNTYVKGVAKYYRIYAHTLTGRIYASNIEGIHVPPRNNLTNGNFENSQNKVRPDNWTYINQGVTSFNYMKLSSQTVKEGKNSLEIIWIDSLANYSHQATLYQRIQTSNLVPGKTYKFSFWAKSGIGDVGATLFIEDKPQYLKIPGGQDWTELSYSFTMTQEMQNMRVEIIAFGQSKSSQHGWIDDMRLEQK